MAGMRMLITPTMPGVQLRPDNLEVVDILLHHILLPGLRLRWVMFKYNRSASYRLWLCYELQRLELWRAEKKLRERPQTQWERLLEEPLPPLPKPVTHPDVEAVDQFLEWDRLTPMERMARHVEALMWSVGQYDD